MQDINDDQDLQNMATHVLNQIASYTYPSAIVHQMIDKFVEILTESPSWHVRVKALPVIQVFYFKHLFTLTKAEMIRVMDVVSGMLMDMQIEVRVYRVRDAFCSSKFEPCCNGRVIFLG